MIKVQHESQRLAVKYFTVAVILFGAQLLMGLIAAYQYLNPEFLFNIFNFSTARMVHINAMVVWMLYAMIGSVYWMLPDETGVETVGIKLGNLAFYILTLAVTIVVLVYILIQVGAGNETSLWFIIEGREYIEAPRWADYGIVAVVLVFVYNVYATVSKGERTGITTILMADLIALAGLYLAGMFYTNNITMDQFWWWWVIHLWVEATWEVFVGVLVAYGLIKVLGAKRQIVEMWLYIEVSMLFGSGILGLGHHYFWIGTPEYWWEIGALFSALEPVPLVGMLVHVIYDMGKHGGKVNNGPAMNWFVVNAFGNFLGAGIWGFMHTLPQINIYTHGSQFTAAHGHLAFFGAYASILIGMMYVAIQRKNNLEEMKNTATSKWAIALITIGVVGMTMALTTSGYIQAFVERGEYGATWDGYFIAQNAKWFLQGIGWRFAMGIVTLLGFVLLVKDFLTISARTKAELAR